MNTQFQVTLFHAISDPAPFVTIPIRAKMPLGAMVFAMRQAHVTSIARVGVTYGEEQTTFYNVALGSKNITYDQKASQML